MKTPSLIVFPEVEAWQVWYFFDSTTTSTESYVYVVTDPTGLILGLPPGDSVDFGGAGIGTCWVWGLSYSGNFTAQVGDNATTVFVLRWMLFPFQ